MPPRLSPPLNRAARRAHPEIIFTAAAVPGFEGSVVKPPPTPKGSLFRFGRFVRITAGASAAMNAAGVKPDALLGRHIRLEQGELCDSDHAYYTACARDGAEVLSAFKVGEGQIWLETSDDRQVTTILLPSEH